MSTWYPSSRSQAASDLAHDLFVVHDENLPIGPHKVNSLGLGRRRDEQGAQIRGILRIDLTDTGGERHGAGPLGTVHQPEQVAGFVQRFRFGAAQQNFAVVRQAVKLLTETRQRDHADAPAELRLAVDERQDRDEQVALR